MALGSFFRFRKLAVKRGQAHPKQFRRLLLVIASKSQHTLQIGHFLLAQIILQGIERAGHVRRRGRRSRGRGYDHKVALFIDKQPEGVWNI